MRQKLTVRIPTYIAGQSVEVPAYHTTTPGLLVVHDGDHWELIHEQSSLPLGLLGSAPLRADAMRLAAQIAGLADWTLPANDIVSRYPRLQQEIADLRRTLAL